MVIFWLTLASGASWFASTLAGGGSPLILIPLIGMFLGASAVPPILTVGMLMGNSHRIWLYWQHINWRVMSWYLPGAVVGGGLGAFIFTRTQLEWLPILLGLFLITSTLSYRLGEHNPVFIVRAWYFLPGGFIYAVLSGLIGSTGPLLNPFYLNYGLTKEAFIATKSANVVVVHIAKLISYGIFGALTHSNLSYGLLIGCAALPGNWLGQQVLEKISEQRFRLILTVFVGLSGTFLLWEERQFLIFW